MTTCDHCGPLDDTAKLLMSLVWFVSTRSCVVGITTPAHSMHGLHQDQLAMWAPISSPGQQGRQGCPWLERRASLGTCLWLRQLARRRGKHAEHAGGLLLRSDVRVGSTGRELAREIQALPLAEDKAGAGSARTHACHLCEDAPDALLLDRCEVIHARHTCTGCAASLP